MGQRREQLQAVLEAAQGSENVYFEPPETVRMQYPCIVYSRENPHKTYADNQGYIYEQRYSLTLISRDADNPVVDTIGRMPKASWLRGFKADGLNHDVLELYY